MKWRECYGCGRMWQWILMEPVAPIDRIYWLCPDCYAEFIEDELREVT